MNVLMGFINKSAERTMCHPPVPREKISGVSYHTAADILTLTLEMICQAEHMQIHTRIVVINACIGHMPESIPDFQIFLYQISHTGLSDKCNNTPEFLFPEFMVFQKGQPASQGK